MQAYLTDNDLSLNYKKCSRILTLHPSYSHRIAVKIAKIIVYTPLQGATKIQELSAGQTVYNEEIECPPPPPRKNTLRCY